MRLVSASSFGAAGSNNPWLSIVGVVGDVKYRGLPANPTKDPDIYLPFLDRNAIVAIAVRTTSEPTAVAAPSAPRFAPPIRRSRSTACVRWTS
jgi:hypothetical protein